MKSLIASAPVLAYYKPGEPLEVQCDSSQAGLGTALMQVSHPIAYASRALTETKTRYAQMEKEMLVIVFAVEKFNDYTFGNKTIVFSYHKPLESILKKPLHCAPIISVLPERSHNFSNRRGCSPIAPPPPTHPVRTPIQVLLHLLETVEGQI